MSAGDPMHKPGAGYVDLTIKHDVQGELRLSDAEMKTLEHLANCGGEVPWQWGDPKTKRATYDMVAGLINQELVIDREYATKASSLVASRVVHTTLRLTDKGRNVVAEHRKRQVVASEIKIIQN